MGIAALAPVLVALDAHALIVLAPRSLVALAPVLVNLSMSVALTIGVSVVVGGGGQQRAEGRSGRLGTGDLQDPLQARRHPRKHREVPLGGALVPHLDARNCGGRGDGATNKRSVATHWGQSRAQQWGQ